jgi:hypothetical protein
MLNEASTAIRNGTQRIKRRWFPSLPSIFLLVALPFFLLPLQIDAQQQEIRFSVLGLFHAREMLLEEGSGAVLSVAASDASSTTPFVLNGEPAHRQLLFRADADRQGSIILACSEIAESLTEETFSPDKSAYGMWSVHPE